MPDRLEGRLRHCTSVDEFAARDADRLQDRLALRGELVAWVMAVSCPGMGVVQMLLYTQVGDPGTGRAR